MQNTNPKIKKMIERPTISALVLCDLIIKEEGTGKLSLVNIFSNINVAQVPCCHPHCYIYIALVDGRGSMPYRLQFVQLNDNTVLAQVDGELEFQNPLRILEITLHLANIPIREPGLHSLDFYLDDTLVGSKRIQVCQLNRSPHF